MLLFLKTEAYLELLDNPLHWSPNLNQQQAYIILTVSVGQGFRNNLPVSFWFAVSHEVAMDMLARAAVTCRLGLNWRLYYLGGSLTS